METAKLRNMLYLQWTKAQGVKNRLFLACLFLLSVLAASAQREELFREEQDQKPYYFGLSLSAVYSRFQIEHSSQFLQQDSVLVAESINSPGISLRLVASLNLSPRFELRFNPGLIFTARPLLFKLNPNYPGDPDFGYSVQKNVESIITTFPLDLKFKSDRIGNFRVYMLGGGKIDMDLAANAQKRKADDQVRLKKYSYGVEGGIGFNFYRKSVTVSPEIKISNGLNDLHDRNPKLNYSRDIDRIRSRMIIFSIHLEG